jgi:hypothetical protein
MLQSSRSSRLGLRSELSSSLMSMYLLMQEEWSYEGGIAFFVGFGSAEGGRVLECRKL